MLIHEAVGDSELDYAGWILGKAIVETILRLSFATKNVTDGLGGPNVTYRFLGDPRGTLVIRGGALPLWGLCIRRRYDVAILPSRVLRFANLWRINVRPQ